LGNPAKYAGFPLFHRLGYGRLTKPDISLATKTGHFNLLTTPPKVGMGRRKAFLALYAPVEARRQMEKPLKRCFS
ncbi:MAG: hypothetical protein ABSG40_13410, partial [Terriglobales bacterium]